MGDPSQGEWRHLWVTQDGRRVSLLFKGIGMLWTEHSERSTIRSWAAAAKIPPDIRRQMGRWRPAADEGYERVVRANILRARRIIASFLRDKKGRGDLMDEAAVYEAVGLRMGHLGYPDEALEEQSSLLVRFQSEELADETSWRPKWTPSGPVALVEPNDPGDINDAATDPGDAGFEFDAELEPGAGDEVVLAEAVAGAVAGQFIVFIVGRSQTRTLHRVGECYRRPGEHYSQFEVLGDEPPDTSKYHRAC